MGVYLSLSLEGYSSTRKSTEEVKGNLAHNFKFFHYMFVSCLLNVVKTLMTGNNENIDIVHIYREKKI